MADDLIKISERDRRALLTAAAGHAISRYFDYGSELVIDLTDRGLIDEMGNLTETGRAALNGTHPFWPGWDRKIIAEWQPMRSYQAGDRINLTIHRSWREVWWERITTWKWNVPLTRMETYGCEMTAEELTV